MALLGLRTTAGAGVVVDTQLHKYLILCRRPRCVPLPLIPSLEDHNGLPLAVQCDIRRQSKYATLEDWRRTRLIIGQAMHRKIFHTSIFHFVWSLQDLATSVQ